MRLRKVLLITGVAVVVVIVAGAVALSTIDLNEHVAFVEAKAKAATGRELRIKGRIGFTLSLLPTVAADDVSFQNAAWGSRPLMARAKRVEVQIALLPLLSGDVVINRLRLLEPDVLLEVNAKGERNWVFAAPKKSTDKAPAAEDGGGGFELRRIEARDGVLAYRQAKPRLAHQARIERLALDAARGFDALGFDGKGALNDVPLALVGRIDSLRRIGEPGASGNIELDADLGGNALQLDGSVPLAGAAQAAFDARFSAELKDVASLRRMLRRPIPLLPATKLKGRASMAKDMLVVEALDAEIGKSRAQGSLRLGLEGAQRAFDARLVASLIDLQELYAVRKALRGASTPKPSDGRVFPNDPLPVAALRALDGEADVRIDKLRLADGNVIDDVRARARFKQGRIDADELKLRLQGRELRLGLKADASSGKSLAVNATLAGEKVPLAALSGLAGIAEAPEGAPTDVAIKFSGRGASVRALMASADADVRVVVGPGRIKSRALDAGADVTELLNALNPARTRDPYTELKCAVLRLPVRGGIAKISNGIAAETSKVRLIGGGTVDLRNETLELGFRPEAARGLGIGAGNLARFAKVEGTLAD
ncbi:MAG: AsmA family protein, partial [Burkholderiales bacterium]|nr:AsmA family protein [Burkholderiales bacterium]